MTFKKITFFPLLIFVVFVAFSVRLVDMMTGISSLTVPAFAQEVEENEFEETIPATSLTELTEDDFVMEDILANAIEPAAGGGKAKKKKKKKEKKPSSDEKSAMAMDDSKKDGEHESDDGKDIETPTWLDSSDSDMQNESVRMEILQDVGERREKLEQQEKALMVREALLKATEKELDRKYQELAQLRSEIEKLLEQQSEEEKARIQSLVKVYEGMKPKDAARIFDTLDLDILVSVMSLMSERKISPVLAAMNAERARTVTILLAEQKQLPTLPLN